MLSLIPRVGEMLRINGRVASIEGGDLRIVVEGSVWRDDRRFYPDGPDCRARNR